MHAFLYLFIYYRLFTGVILRKLNWAHFRREKKNFALIRDIFALIAKKNNFFLYKKWAKRLAQYDFFQGPPYIFELTL